MALEKRLGDSKITSGRKVTIPKEVMEILGEKAKIGNYVIFEKDKKGEVYIRAGEVN